MIALTFFPWPTSQFNTKPLDIKEIKRGGEKNQYAVLYMLWENFSLSRMPGVCIPPSGRKCETKKWGFSGREGMTRLQGSSTNWHRPRRKGAVWCSWRTLCSNDHQSCCTAGSHNSSRTRMHTCIVWRREFMDAHRQRFDRNISLSVTVRDELLVGKSIFICDMYFHAFLITDLQ